MPLANVLRPKHSMQAPRNQHALKGQKLLAQGNALGMRSVSNAPCKGKSFKIHIIKMVNQLRYVKLLPLQGARFANIKNPGRMPWAKSFWAFSPYLNHLRNLSKEVKKLRSFRCGNGSP